MKRVIRLAVTFLAIFICNCTIYASDETLSMWLSNEEVELLRPAIDKFQELYPEVTLEIETYSIYDLRNASQQMKTQLMAGKGPDLLMFCSTGLDDVYKFLKAGVFVSLNEFIENDAYWNETDYVSSVMEAGAFEGKQYVIPLTYRFTIALGSKEKLEKVDFDFSMAENTLGFMSEMAKLYELDYNDRVLADGGLGSFPMLITSNFLNYETGEVEVDKAILESACNAYVSIYADDFRNAFPDTGYAGFGKLLADEEAYFYVTNSMSGLMSAVSVLSVTDTSVLLPLRTVDNETTADICRYVGIRANSGNKDNAWNMIKILLEEEMQREFAEAVAEIPVLRTAIEEVVAACAEESPAYSAEVLEATDIDQVLVDEYLCYIAEPGRCDFLNEFLLNDFYSYMEPFYKGEASFSECYDEFYLYSKIYLTE